MTSFHDGVVPLFEDFSERIADGRSDVVEILITEDGDAYPSGGKFEKIPVKMSNVTGLNMGRDAEEYLYKYTHDTGKIGPVKMMQVAIPVRIDMTTHAAHQQYRWEHRWQPVGDDEILSDVQMAAPKIVHLAVSDQLPYGTMASVRTGTASNMKGLVWIFNIRTKLNIIAQVRQWTPEDRGEKYLLKVTVITILRGQNVTFSKASEMPKITVSETEARIAYVPKKTTP